MKSMVKNSKIMMSPFQLDSGLCEAFKEQLAQDGLSLTKGYERALKKWLDSRQVEKDGTSTQEKPHCPPGMCLVPAVAVPELLHKALVQEAEIVEGWDKLTVLMAEWFLEAKHRKPRPPVVYVPPTPEEKRAAKIEACKHVAKVRFENGYAPVIGPLVFRHRKPHPRPWELVGLTEPDYDVPGLAEQIKELCEVEYAEHERAQEVERRERAAQEPPEQPRAFRFDLIGGGCGEELRQEMEALKAGIPLSTLKIKPEPKVKPAQEDFC